MVANRQPFALARFADGERAIIEQRSITGIDGWSTKPELSKLSLDLLSVLNKYQDSGCHFGISDDVNDLQTKLFFSNILKKTPAKCITMSNVFVNGTYERFQAEMVPKFKEYSQVFLICNSNTNILAVEDVIPRCQILYCSRDCIGFWERAGERWIADLMKNTNGKKDCLFIFAAGPLSSAVIPRLWEQNTNNTYIDVGSALDPLLYGQATRPYHVNGHPDSKQLASIEIQDDIINSPGEGISCILNCYKRHDLVIPWLEAIRCQTVTPREIHILFNECPPDSLLKTLDNYNEITNVVVSRLNLGVWNRFAYALNSKEKFICIFDDDTIPGRRWLENCSTSFEREPGIYGTVGLRLFSPERYMDHQRYGWPSANTETVEVDLVGHSWFFLRDWLSFYWRDLPPVSGFSFMGEDMHLSFAVQKYLKLNTFVPPHPKDDEELWGSLYPSKGCDENAISMTGKASRMDFAVTRLLKLGGEQSL